MGQSSSNETSEMKKIKQQKEKQRKNNIKFVKARIPTLFIMETSARIHSVNINWIQQLLDETINLVCNEKVINACKNSDLMKRIKQEMDDKFDNDNLMPDKVRFDFLLERREEILRQNERIINNARFINFYSIFYCNLEVDVEVLCILMSGRASNWATGKVERSEIINYIIQLYFCITTLAKHTTEGQAKLLFNSYNGYLAKFTADTVNIFDKKGQGKGQELKLKTKNNPRSTLF
jgi:hypothetical protein